MPHVTIEYMIMIPMLILQIFLFPLAANWIMAHWTESRRTLALQEVASHLGSTIQQMYFLLNHKSTPIGNVTQRTDIPPTIDNYAYVGNAVLRKVLDPALDPTGNSSRMLVITLQIQTLGTVVTASALMGQNAVWLESVFISTSKTAGILAGKLPNETIWLSFDQRG